MATGVAAQGALFVSGILAARMLGPADRGYLALLVVIPSTICQVGSLGFSLSATYFIARNPLNAAGVMRVLRNPALAQVVLLTLVHVAVVIFVIRDKPDDVVVTAVLSLASVPASYALEYGLAVLQGVQRFGIFNTLRVVPNFVYSVILLALLAFDAGELTVIFLSSLVGVAGAGVLALATALRRLPPVQDPDEVPAQREVLGFGLKSYLGYVSPVESLRIDQLIIGAVLTPAALGLYVVATAFTNLARFIGQSIGLVAAPHVAALEDPAHQVRATWRFFWLACALCGAITAVLLVAVPWLTPLLFGDEYEDAGSIGQVLVVGAFFLAARRVLTDGARGCGLPAMGSFAELASAIWFVPATLLLIGPMDETGVAVAWASATAFGFVVLLVGFVRRTGGLPKSGDRI